MAKGSAGIGFRDIMLAIRHKQFSPVYILMGEETFYIDQLTKALEASVVAEEDRDFNSITFYGSDCNIADVVACARELPVMSGQRIVLLKEAQSMYQAKTALDNLVPYLGKPNSTTVLVVAYKGGTLPATSKIMKAASKANCIVFNSQLIKDRYLPGAVKDYCATKKLDIDEKAVTLLCECIGNPLSKLFGEIDKLGVSLAGNGRRITPELIETNIGISKDYNNFELVAALSRKDYVQAIRIVDYFARNPKSNSTEMTLGMLFSFYQKLSIAAMTRDRSDTSLMAALDVSSPYALKDVKTALSFYTPKKAVDAIHHLRWFDASSKGIGSYQDKYELLKELMFRLVT